LFEPVHVSVPVPVVVTVGRQSAAIFPSLPVLTVTCGPQVSFPSNGCTWFDIAGTRLLPGDAVPFTSESLELNADHGTLTKVEFAPPYPMVRLLVEAELAYRYTTSLSVITEVV
jgi:hypothetical protein